MMHLHQWFNAKGGLSGGPNVVALLHMDGADASTTFTDETGKTWTVNGDAQIDTAQFKFGGASGLFGGSGFLSITHADMAMGTGDFTAEFFIRFASTQTSNMFGQNSSTAGWTMYCINNVVRLHFNGTDVITTTSTLTASQWFHVAVSRSGNNHMVFIDGIQEGGTYTAANDYSDTVFGMGCLPSGVFQINGHMDEVRITKGVARYTSNFTPPSAPFPNS